MDELISSHLAYLQSKGAKTPSYFEIYACELCGYGKVTFHVVFYSAEEGRFLREVE